MPDLLTTEEVAEILRAPAATLRYWRNAPTGLYGPRSIKVGRRTLYERADVERWIADEQARQHTASGSLA
jgi:DNA-binding transcriptional MerR regulator